MTLAEAVMAFLFGFSLAWYILKYLEDQAIEEIPEWLRWLAKRFRQGKDGNSGSSKE